MTDKNRILIVVDPLASNEQTSVRRGVWLANQLALGLDLLICHTDPYLSGSKFFSTDDVERARTLALDRYREKLDQMARPLRDRGLDVTVTVLFDAPLDEAIVRHALATCPKIVVKETHYHSKISRTILSNTDWNLVRLCPEPLWLAKSGDWPNDATILASVDPTHESDEYFELDDRILDTASLLANKLSRELHVFNSFVPLSAYVMPPDGPGIYGMGGVEESLQQAHLERVDSLLDGYRVAKEHVHVKQGSCERLLPKLATDIDAGLVVMGSIARNALQRLFVGSTTERVLDKLPCDLLVVKPIWFKCPLEVEEMNRWQGAPKNEVAQADAASRSADSKEPASTGTSPA